jgi:tetratricopeptide (TPR) repeat protein
MHALSARDNILYNGQIALDKGISDVKSTYKDNFWELLPIERMQVTKEEDQPETAKNANFERAETKATKAIQKHSMNINGIERNYQMDEAYLLLGKTRYYDQRFIPAFEAFNYVLYKSPTSDKILEARIWREKTNMRLENDALALNNLKYILKDVRLKKQILADANATISQAFINVGKKDSAIASLKIATQFTKSKEEKARYRFILAQIYQELGYKDSASIAYQSVIDMKRKSPRIYVIHAKVNKAQLAGYEKTDSISFLKTFNKLLADRENRPFLDVLHHHLALYYDKNNKIGSAKKEYNKSLKAKTGDTYTIASNYRNLADIYFKEAKYPITGKYFDSTLVQLKPRSREFRFIKKKRENLDDVIKYEGIANRNDSVINVFKMSELDRIAYYEKYILKLKKEDDLKKAVAAKADEKNKQNNKPADGPPLSGSDAKNASQKGEAPPTNLQASASIGKESDFYFYNSKSVAYGKLQFKKTWGNRAYKNNWRLSSEAPTNSNNDPNLNNDPALDPSIAKEEKTEEKYTASFYLKELPTSQKVIDSITRERNFAYYQLGSIYKEKFKEYQLAANKLEQLLNYNPEERLVLPSMYNLYKIYEIINKEKALAMKAKIISQYPNSRYAEILSNTNPEIAAADAPEVTYNKLFKLYELGDYRTVNDELEKGIDQFAGEEIVAKYELLRANTTGKLKGVAEYKKALNFVALNYPNNIEGKQAEEIIKKEVPVLESYKFYAVAPKSWKIVYRVPFNDEKNKKILSEKIKKFVTDHKLDHLTFSEDIYNSEDNFMVIHGIISEEFSKGIIDTLKIKKEYKIQQKPIIISNYNYKVVQINKNIEDYLVAPVVAPNPIVKTPVTPTVEPQKEFKKQADSDPLDSPDKKNEGVPPPANMDSGNITPVLINKGAIEKEELTKPNK